MVEDGFVENNFDATTTISVQSCVGGWRPFIHRWVLQN